MNNNASTNPTEGVGKQGPLRRKQLVSQAEAQNKTMNCKNWQQKRRCIRCKKKCMKKTAVHIIN